MKTINCKHCNGVMSKTTISSGNCLGIAIALVLFAVGVGLCFTGIGAIVGIPLCLCALFVGGKKKKVWKCKSCSSIIDRA